MKSPQPSQRRGALKLFLLLLICLAPLIGALFVYQSRDNMLFMTKNHGTLIIPSISLETLGVDVPKPARWLLAYYTPNNCEADCQKVLEHFSIMESSLIKDKPRIESILLSPHPLVETNVLFRQTNNEPREAAIWLIDPLGNIILRYDTQSLDNRMLLDLRYLLKVSQIG